MQWTWHMTLLMTVGQKWQYPVWWEWTERGWRWRCQVSPEYLASCPVVPSSMARAQQLFIRRFLGTDSKTKTQDSASIRIQVRGSPDRVRAPHSDCIVKKAKISYPLQAWFSQTPITKVFMLCYARNFYYLLVLCYSHPMKAVFAWVTVHYERLFSNSQSPMMDEEQVTSPISFWSFWTFSFSAKKWSAISKIR